MEDAKILALLASACAAPQICTNLNLDLISSGLLDSLALITFLNSLEDEMNIEIQPTQAEHHEWATPASVLALIHRLHA